MKAKIKTYGETDPAALKQIQNCSQEADYAVLCADHHVGYSMPIGGAVAYKNHVSPSGVGFDIACGNKAVMTDMNVKDINVKKVMDEIALKISFGIGRVNPEPVEHPVLEKIENTDFKPQKKMITLASEQLGTVGSGNHYVDLFEDEKGRLWIGVHFGSRGFGHRTAMGFLALAQGLSFESKPKNADSMDMAPVLLDIHSELGIDYIEAMNLAGEYAYAGRNIVVNKVLEIVGAKSLFEVHNHHNFAWQEEHFGEKYWLIRKGCTPAFPGQQSFIGSNMRDNSFIIEGIDCNESKEALYSTVHGAGRILSRTQAAGKRKWKKGKLISVTGGIINFQKVREDIRDKGIELRGGGADEAPEVYKNLNEVLNYHQNTVKILHRLKPVGVAMAGEDIYDPYKD
ncbi:MAG: RNA-splicing ligase RtcB [Ignavibacteria bacterium]|nr:RNA-splicing ligase RtcB [Ignavibacteria bacterium]